MTVTRGMGVSDVRPAGERAAIVNGRVDIAGARASARGHTEAAVTLRSADA